MAQMTGAKRNPPPAVQGPMLASSEPPASRKVSLKSIRKDVK
jgi:hypothetical protein